LLIDQHGARLLEALLGEGLVDIAVGNVDVAATEVIAVTVEGDLARKAAVEDDATPGGAGIGIKVSELRGGRGLNGRRADGGIADPGTARSRAFAEDIVIAGSAKTEDNLAVVVGTVHIE